jgi:protein-L-isoaspartate O-methyltransferase
MTPQPRDHSNQKIYAPWHRPLLEKLFGDAVDLRYDLYELTHSHRREHNGGLDEGPCVAWPSPPYRAPVWRIVAEAIGATRFLEIGTAVGYTAALMADAGGPGCRVDTVENDAVHADMAEAELEKRGLLDRVQVLRGDALDVLPDLAGPYDVVFLDGGGGDFSEHVDRLLRPGGAAPEIKGRLQEPLLLVLTELKAAIDAREQPEAVALSRARDAYRDAVVAALQQERAG